MRSRTALLVISAAMAGMTGLVLAATFTPLDTHGATRAGTGAVVELAYIAPAADRTRCRPAGEHPVSTAVEGESS